VVYGKILTRNNYTDDEGFVVVRYGDGVSYVVKLK